MIEAIKAYIQALEQAAPYMAKLPILDQILGGEEAWSEDADSASRWSSLLNSGHKDGQELSTAWSYLKQEARESALYLGEEVDGVLAEPVEGAGHSTTGHTRTSITEQREKTRARILLEALKQHPQREARPVWSWEDRDKLSAAFLLCLPKPDTTFSFGQVHCFFTGFLMVESG